jgi:hypothetical protein
MTDQLTAVELADIEARQNEASITIYRHSSSFADIAALLAALREARALVEALLEYGKPWRAQNEYPDYGGPDTYCPVCKHETWGDFDAGLHAPDCGLMAAWNALARWRGDKPAEEEK